MDYIQKGFVLTQSIFQDGILMFRNSLKKTLLKIYDINAKLSTTWLNFSLLRVIYYCKASHDDLYIKKLLVFNLSGFSECYLLRSTLTESFKATNKLIIILWVLLFICRNAFCRISIKINIQFWSSQVLQCPLKFRLNSDLDFFLKNLSTTFLAFLTKKLHRQKTVCGQTQSSVLEEDWAKK